MKLANRLYDRLRHPQAFGAAGGPGGQPDLGALEGHKYALLTTFRANGDPVPTPVWFGLSDGRAYVRTGADTAKVRRIRRDPRVRLCPCTARGRPLGPWSEGRARVLGPAAEDAEEALRANYGLGRRLYERTVGSRVDAVYLEIAPSGGAG
jgi:uncharacterized protein